MEKRGEGERYTLCYNTPPVFIFQGDEAEYTLLPEKHESSLLTAIDAVQREMWQTEKR